MVTAGICWLLKFNSYPEEQFLPQIWEDKYNIFWDGEVLVAQTCFL